PVGDFVREVLERGLLGGNRRVLRRDNVDTGIGAGGGIDHDRAAAEIDELIACAQRAAFAADGFVGQQPETFEVVVEQHVEAVARRSGGAALRQPVAQRVANEPPSLTFDRRHFDGRQPLRHRAAATAGIHRLQAATRQGGQQRQRRGEARVLAHATMLTNRSGTTITLRTGAPSIARWTFSLASASASSSGCGSPLATVSVSRSLPFTWTAMVTSSSTSSAGSTSGQPAFATSPLSPSARQPSSARCGIIGEASSRTVRIARLRSADGAAFSAAEVSS